MPALCTVGKYTAPTCAPTLMPCVRCYVVVHKFAVEMGLGGYALYDVTLPQRVKLLEKLDYWEACRIARDLKRISRHNPREVPAMIKLLQAAHA